MGLSLETRAKSLHRDVQVIDAHYDLLIDVEIQRSLGRRRVIETDYLDTFKEGGVKTIVAAIFIDNDFLPEMGLRKALNQISVLYDEISESSDKIMLCKSMHDLIIARKEEKVAFILSLEGAEPIGNDLSLLRIFYELGVRLLGLVWSRRNYVGDGSTFSPIREGKKGGITEFGVRVIEAAEEMGMIIDVSHLNDEGFADVMKIARKPVIASHSNCRSIADSMRNLTDQQIKDLAHTNGVIGMNANNFFTANKDEDAHVEYLLHHVDHIVKLVGVEHVGLGLDLCDDFLKYISQASLEHMPRKPFDVVHGHKSVPKLTEGLLKRGYSDKEIELILGLNFERVYREVWK
ncbi:dipeptidase [Brevibacillus daliensis]|uniref:dipeptidase n=1 Tax=Brevibacillus daliensis TaxID=2892995 RepID=UPI001E4A7C43|nr:dipeptidase [Brevibacillus daliensis]